MECSARNGVLCSECLQHSYACPLPTYLLHRHFRSDVAGGAVRLGTCAPHLVHRLRVTRGEGHRKGGGDGR